MGNLLGLSEKEILKGFELSKVPSNFEIKAGDILFVRVEE
jgi:hypothetical protein